MAEKSVRQHQRSSRIKGMNMVEVEILYDQWKAKREEVEHEEDQFLRDSGWNYTCNMPGSLWLWTKKFDGIDSTIAVGKATALIMELRTRHSPSFECALCKADLAEHLDNGGAVYRAHKPGEWVCSNHGPSLLGDKVTQDIIDAIRGVE